MQKIELPTKDDLADFLKSCPLKQWLPEGPTPAEVTAYGVVVTAILKKSLGVSSTVNTSDLEVWHSSSIGIHREKRIHYTAMAYANRMQRAVLHWNRVSGWRA